MSSDSLATRLAEWVISLDAAALPRRASDAAKLLILDQLGLQIKGAGLANVEPQRELVRAMRAAPESTVVAGGLRTVAPYAAFVNGTQASSCELDDMHMLASHVGSYVVPAALAFGESVSAPGAEVIAAIVGGAQVMALLGATTSIRMVNAGWHGAKIVGTFGAAAAAGRLLALTESELANAFGIAGSDAAGTMEYEHGGGEVKRMHAGSAGRNGAQAALLAQAGLTGPASIFDGDRGILRMFGGTDEQASPDQWSHLHIVDTMFRMYPAIGSAAPALDAAQFLRRQRGFDWREIDRIRLGMPSFAVSHGASVTRPKDTVSAQFSTAFGLALLLCRDMVRMADYADPQAWKDPDLLSVVDRIEPHPMDFPADWPALSCHMEIVLKDGRVLVHAQRGFRGHPDDPQTNSALLGEKFRANVAGRFEPSETESVIDLVSRLDGDPDVGHLMALVQGSP